MNRQEAIHIVRNAPRIVNDPRMDMRWTYSPRSSKQRVDEADALVAEAMNLLDLKTVIVYREGSGRDYDRFPIGDEIPTS